MIDEDDCGAIGGMKIGRGNRSSWRKPAPAPLCPPQRDGTLIDIPLVGSHFFFHFPATLLLLLVVVVVVGRY
jgi:hypothetical protein